MRVFYIFYLFTALSEGTPESSRWDGQWFPATPSPNVFTSQSYKQILSSYCLRALVSLNAILSRTSSVLSVNSKEAMGWA